MGSYSCEDHRLPFLEPRHVQAASAINAAMPKALLRETGQKYKGILYGGFMATRDGIRLLEYNARFRDPGTMNVLPLLATAFFDTCEATSEDKLATTTIPFQKKATVCKYLVPRGYPDNPLKGERLDLSRLPKESAKLRVYHAAVEERAGHLYMTGSRALAL